MRANFESIFILCEEIISFLILQFYNKKVVCFPHIHFPPADNEQCFGSSSSSLWSWLPFTISCLKLYNNYAQKIAKK